MNTPDFNPFLHYSAQLQILLKKADKQTNPAMWLFKSNARTSFLMLEALTRLHYKTVDEKTFSKWNKRFKKLEDLFGQIDYYTAYEKQFKSNKKIKKETLAFFTVSKVKVIEKCNKLLREKEWFTKKMLSFDKKIIESEIVYNEEFINQIKTSIQKEIENIKSFCSNKNYAFTLLEEEVHEVRRKLRWISIYAQALKGLIQLKKSSKGTKQKINYFTKAILSLPYNKLPSKPKNVTAPIIEFDSNAFFALSWMINELGILKDKGLSIDALTDAIVYTEDITEYQANEKAIKLMGIKTNTEQTILKEASEIAYVFMSKDKMLDKLIV